MLPTFARAMALCVVVLFLTGTPAQAFGWRWSRVSYAAPVICYDVPVYVMPIQCVPIAGMPQRMFAVPTPAPATQTKEPPLGAPPKISDSYSYERYYGPVATEAASTAPAKDKCRVGFWNVSGRAVTLTISGRVYSLPRNKSLTLELNREFLWNIDGRATQIERVADAEATHEIVIRQ